MAARLEAVRRTTVLLLNWLPDGRVIYGAGVVLDHEGRVLTSRHVVSDSRRLGALLYRADRVSYTPMDGGLSRYIFENHSEIIGARLLDESTPADLALVQIDADTRGVALLTPATERPRLGERVWVIGHPQEAVWSLNQGVISGLPAGAIQHDALVSAGSSGGPVLNEHGELIGISSAKVVSEARGFAFARPIEWILGWLARGSGPPPIDRSSPERAALSCWRAFEHGSRAVVDCYDWDHSWRLYLRAAAELERRVGGSLRLGAPDTKERWIAARKQKLLQNLRGAGRCAPGETPPSATGLNDVLAHERSRVFAELRAHGERLTESWRVNNGLKENLRDESVLAKVIRMGIRVEAIERVEGGRAWVLMAGRNTDGSSFRFSELYSAGEDLWRQHAPPSAEDRNTLPVGWPPPLEDAALQEQRLLLSLLDGLVRESS